MHDPMTVAHEIKYPWFKERPWPKRKREWESLTDKQKRGRSPHWREGYRESFITIWHVDPERGGSDDSCGFSIPHLTERQRERLKNWAWHEGYKPYFLKRAGHEWRGTRHEAESMYRGLLLWVAQIIEIPMTFDEAAAEAARVIHNPDCIDAANSFCFEPGYHTNIKTDDRDERERYFVSIISGMARWLLKDRRPWYKHPRWHIWHWKIQIHPLQAFKRWAFSRCCKCGGRFRNNECVISGSWSGTGPLWFRSEKNIYHDRCSSVGSDEVKQSAVANAKGAV